MKIRMYFGKLRFAVLALVFVGSLAIMALDIAVLAGAISVSYVTSAVSLAACALMAAMSLLIILNSYYRFYDDKFVSVIGFFVDKIPYDSIIVVKQNIATRELFVITDLHPQKGDPNQKTAVSINLSGASTDKFLNELKNHVPSLAIEYFSLPKKKRKE